ncbi:MAG TPA: arylsulfotransferase family protein [Solirubrobacteraceae bacterium]|nr:arylsulfotransferase family protein [Solirubrobacteraceae bacterium]
MPTGIRSLAIAAAAACLAATAIWAAPVQARGIASYISAPGLHPPKLAPKVDRAGKAGGLLLLDPFAISAAAPAGQTGPLIVEDDGMPVWFHPLPAGELALDFTEQTYAGRPALSWWQGRRGDGGLTNLAAGPPQPGARYYVYGQRYRQLATVLAQEGWTADPDELTLTGHGTALLIASKVVPMDLAAYGGAPSGELLDSEIQEVSLKTGRLLFKWDMLEHVPLGQSETVPPLTGIWDPYQLDSVQELGGRRLLISARNTWTVYEIDSSSGEIVWRLGGKDSSFQLGPQASFYWQSDARLEPGNRLTLYDDGCCEATASGLGPAQGAARGLVLGLHESEHTATLVGQYRHSPGLQSSELGSVQTLPNGNALIGWGGLPNLSEYTSAGKLVYAVSLPAADANDRVVRAQWHGMPATRPSVVARRAGGRTTVYVSWNGATQVRFWQVFAGPSAGSLNGEIADGEIIAFALPSGFQTAIPVSVGGPVFEVEALGANNRVLGVSQPVRALAE